MMGQFKSFAGDIYTGMTQLIDLYLHSTFSFFASSGTYQTTVLPPRTQHLLNRLGNLIRPSGVRFVFAVSIVRSSLYLQVTVSIASIFDSLPPLTLNTFVNLASAETLYGLSARVVACESLLAASLACILVSMCAGR